MVSWLTAKSAANERRLLVLARARMVDSCVEVNCRDDGRSDERKRR